MKKFKYKLRITKKAFDKDGDYSGKLFYDQDFGIIPSEFTNNYIYYLENYFYLNKDVILTSCNKIEIVKDFLRTASINVIDSCYRTSYYYLDEMLLSNKNEIKSLEGDLVRTKNIMRDTIKSMQIKEAWGNVLKSKINSIIKNYKIEEDSILFTFKNVVAEDTESEGCDINLGDLVFQVPIKSGEDVKLIDGTYPHNTEYVSGGFHPHQLYDDGRCCFGTQYVDLNEAIEKLEFGIVEAILYKFAHSYTSTDSAGKYYKRWAGEPMDEDEDEYGEDDDNTVWSDYENDYIDADEAVYLNGDYYSPESVTFSEYHDEYIVREDSIYCEHIDDNCEEDCCVELNDGTYMPSEHEDVYVHEDIYYHISELVEDPDNNYIPKNLAVEVDGVYYLKNECVEATTIDIE